MVLRQIIALFLCGILDASEFNTVFVKLSEDKQVELGTIIEGTSGEQRKVMQANEQALKTNP